MMALNSTAAAPVTPSPRTHIASGRALLTTPGELSSQPNVIESGNNNQNNANSSTTTTTMADNNKEKNQVRRTTTASVLQQQQQQVVPVTAAGEIPTRTNSALDQQPQHQNHQNGHHHHQQDRKLQRNEQQEQEKQQHIYEDIDLKCPPNLAPVSGVFDVSNSSPESKSIIKPIAFKPVAPSAQSRSMFSSGSGGRGSSTSPLSSSDSYETSNCPTDQLSNGGGVIANSSTPKSFISQSQCNLSQNSFFLEDDNWYSQLVLKLPDTPGSGSRGQVRRSATFNSDDLAVGTPSPSDSGIVELEAMLREKDSEICYLRETLEQNEQVIFKVYEEKEQTWQREFKKLNIQYEASLAAVQQRLVKSEQRHAFQAQQARKAQSEADDAKRANLQLENKIGQLQEELSSLKVQIEETLWTLCEKTAEISLLQSQLKDSKGSRCSRDAELSALRAQLQETRTIAEQRSMSALKLEEELSLRRQESSEIKDQLEVSARSLQKQLENIISEKDLKLPATGQLRAENENLKYQVGNLREELETTKEAITEERFQWDEEKERVIRYQKQLNANYLHLMKKNKELEAAIRQTNKFTSRNTTNKNNDESHC